nr:hypothetical protein P5631_05855 [Bacillus subtilis]
MNPMDRQTEGQEPQHQDRQPGIESKMNPRRCQRTRIIEEAEN